MFMLLPDSMLFPLLSMLLLAPMLYWRGQCHEIFCRKFFLRIIFPQAPDYNIRVISNFFENLLRYFQVKMQHRSQRHWRKFVTGVTFFRRFSLTIGVNSRKPTTAWMLIKKEHQSLQGHQHQKKDQHRWYVNNSRTRATANRSKTPRQRRCQQRRNTRIRTDV